MAVQLDLFDASRIGDDEIHSDNRIGFVIEVADYCENNRWRS
jgi:hypothetical protein